MRANDINLNASSYRSLFSSSSGKLYVPVNPSVAVYTQFTHVKGTPAEKGERGVPVERLRILNTLIDNLVSMKKSPVSKEEAASMDAVSQDALIASYQRQIHTAVESASAPGTYGLAGLLPEPGAVFSISA